MGSGAKRHPAPFVLRSSERRLRPAFAIGRFLWHRGDEKTIDRFGPNGSAWVVQLSSRVAGRLQNGYVYTYAFVMLIGLTAVVTWAIAQ